MSSFEFLRVKSLDRDKEYFSQRELLVWKREDSLFQQSRGIDATATGEADELLYHLQKERADLSSAKAKGQEIDEIG